MPMPSMVLPWDVRAFVCLPWDVRNEDVRRDADWADLMDMNDSTRYELDSDKRKATSLSSSINNRHCNPVVVIDYGSG